MSRHSHLPLSLLCDCCSLKEFTQFRLQKYIAPKQTLTRYSSICGLCSAICDLYSWTCALCSAIYVLYSSTGDLCSAICALYSSIYDLCSWTCVLYSSIFVLCSSISDLCSAIFALYSWSGVFSLSYLPYLQIAYVFRDCRARITIISS